MWRSSLGIASVITTIIRRPSSWRIRPRAVPSRQALSVLIRPLPAASLAGSEPGVSGLEGRPASPLQTADICVDHHRAPDRPEPGDLLTDAAARIVADASFLPSIESAALRCPFGCGSGLRSAQRSRDALWMLRWISLPPWMIGSKDWMNPPTPAQGSLAEGAAAGMSLLPGRPPKAQLC